MFELYFKNYFMKILNMFNVFFRCDGGRYLICHTTLSNVFKSHRNQYICDKYNSMSLL